MTTDKQALMPCPFCGSTNLYERRINGGHGESDAHIACLNCGAMGPSDYGRDHNAAWNNRPELAAVTAEQDALREALTQQQAAEPVDDGAMFDWIDARARETFSRHKSGARGQQITAADNPESHLIWAALAWARLHPPKPAAQPQVPEGYRLIPAHVLEVAEDVVRFVSSFTEFNGYTSEELATVASALLAAKEEGK